MTKKRESIRKILSHNKSIFFPLTCSIFSTSALLVAQVFNFTHANWIVGTALIVMLPDSYQSIYKSLQRILGTIMGVLVASLILYFVHDPKILIIFVFIFSFLMPNGFSKNYWIANVYIATMILVFLELGVPNSVTSQHLGFWRIFDVLLGSIIGIIAALFLNPELAGKLIKKLK
jgi:uncharacterized membrane protein YccC